MRRWSLAVVATLVGLACGGNDGDGAGGAGVGGAGNGGPGSGASGGAGAGDALPCPVAELLAERCQNCHSDPPRYGAPMPLVTRGHLLADAVSGGRVAELAIARMQDEDRMPPPPNAAASAAEIAVLQDWLDAGTPAGDGSNCGSGGAGGAGGEYPLGCEPDVAVTPSQPFEMPASSHDEQVCFGIDLPASNDKRHIIAIAPRIDNETIVHHMLLLESPTSVGAGPTDCAFTAPEWKLLYGWGPGAPPQILPPEAGFPLDAGSAKHLVLQIHYNNLGGLVGETDQSGVDLCTTTDLRPNDADLMAFGGTSINIPPQSTASLDCSSPVPAIVDSYFPITVFQSWPHMHTLGDQLWGEVDHGSTSTPLVDVQDYSFEYQIAYSTPATIDVGDTVRTRCTWVNNTGNSVSFGENTGNEMCFNFLAYYPRITAPGWSWLLPAQTADCTMQ
jgi:hypothetical protein